MQMNTFYLVERDCSGAYPVELNSGTIIAKRKF
jgi:hypothetical protein